MDFDLRKAIAALFLILGSLLAAFGFFSPGTKAEVPPDFNVNLVWGVAMMLFAGLLTISNLARRHR